MKGGSDSSLLLAVVAGFAVWSIYRRLRASVGRQRLSRPRAAFRVVVMGVVAVLVVTSYALRSPWAAASAAGGFALGGALARLGLRLTSFERTGEGTYYRPNTYVGLALFTIFASRLVFRVATLGTLARPPRLGPAPPVPFTVDPLTGGITLLFVGYFLFYSAGLLARARAEDERGAPPA